MIETKIQIKTEPNLLAPTPSKFLTLVKDKSNPNDVLKTTNQKKELVRVELFKEGISPKNRDKLLPKKCAREVPKKANPKIIIKSESAASRFTLLLKLSIFSIKLLK